MLKEKFKDLNAITVETNIKTSEEGLLKNRKVIVKDNVSTKEIETTASSGILIDYIPVFNATIMDKMIEASADIVAKTTLDELALGGTGLTPVQGPTHNPYDINRISGGSSSGSAALMGTHQFDFAIGSDTGDSIRKPAAYCGIVGIKPTYGRISRYGIIPYASSLDHVGYFTNNVMDSALMLKVLAGHDPKDHTSSQKEVDDYTDITGELKGRTVGVINNLIDAKSDDPIKEHFLSFIEELKQQGVNIKYIDLDADLMKTILPVYFIIANCEATANHANLDGLRFGQRVEGNNLTEIMTNSRTKGFGPLLKRRFVIGSYALDENHQEELFRKAQRVRRLIVEAYEKAMADVDTILTLASDSVAPLIKNVNTEQLSSSRILAENHLVLDNFSGYPSITIPFGHLDGMPYGINLASKAFDEKTLFDIALGFEKLIDFDSKDKEVNPWRTK